jgi:hypothetical protein
MFGMLDAMAGRDDVVDEIETLCRLNMSEHEAERLVGWIAWRTGRNQALAGDADPLTRLHHALVHWLDPHQRARLLGWMRTRLDRGDPLVPR